MGKNISYSLSPKIHKFLFEHSGIEAKYSIINCEKADLIKIIYDSDFYGFNVTIPYKRSLNNFCTSEESIQTGSINTLSKLNGKITGYNTDIFGFIKAIELAGISLSDVKSATILGTGGVAQAIAYALNKNNVFYKFVSRCKQGENIINYNNIEHDDAELLINATPIGMPPQSNSLVLRQEILRNYKYIMDTAYSLKSTPLQRFAKENSIAFANGLIMLVAQAIHSQNIWFDNIHSGKENELIKEIIRNLKESL